MPQTIFDSSQIDFGRPGKYHYVLAFHFDGTWGYSLLPMTVINGLRGSNPQGVVAFGGTHGNEWEGQVAVKRLCQDLDPQNLSGRVILLPQLSESACCANSRTSPLDGVNMNRAFPGKRDGTVSQRIAHFVTSLIFPQVRVVLDIHSGGNEGWFPFLTSFHYVSDPSQQKEMSEVARLFDTAFVMIYSKEMASGLLTDEAESLGKITIGTELGWGESVNPQGVAHAYEGIKNVLRHYGLLSEPTVRIAPDRKTSPRFVSVPRLESYVPCPEDGIWEPTITPGEDVKEGQLIGRLHDFNDHTAPALAIRSPRHGVVIMIHYPALIKKGKTLFAVGEEKEM